MAFADDIIRLFNNPGLWTTYPKRNDGTYDFYKEIKYLYDLQFKTNRKRKKANRKTNRMAKVSKKARQREDETDAIGDGRLE